MRHWIRHWLGIERLEERVDRLDSFTVEAVTTINRGNVHMLRCIHNLQSIALGAAETAIAAKRQVEATYKALKEHITNDHEIRIVYDADEKRN